jgi:PQQ system protein
VLELVNDDPWDPHCAILPSNGDKQWMWLPIYSRGTATLNLDGPGSYWFPLAHRQQRGPRPARRDHRAGRRPA